MQKVLITGVAGFIGFSLANKLISEGINVLGIDNLNDYYDINLKHNRIYKLESVSKSNFQFIQMDLSDSSGLIDIFSMNTFDYVFHLAAQAGVRYSVENPTAYFEANVVGTYNLIEIVKTQPIKRFILASTSSIYGDSEEIRIREDQPSNPIQFYAVTKVVDEIMAKAYSEIYNLKVTVFRFFTVYGPWGRPDMALFKFVKKIIDNEPIDIYNNGKHKRSFTYIDDVVYYLKKLMESEDDDQRYQVYNLGNPVSVELLDFVSIIETLLKTTSQKRFLPLQFGDVNGNVPDITKLVGRFGQREFTDINTGISEFIKWFRWYYKV